MAHISAVTVALCALLFVVLGTLWVVGYDFVKRRSPESLPRFYIVLAIVRCLAILTVAAVYILLVADSVAEAKAFAVMLMVMYALTMVVSLVIRH